MSEGNTDDTKMPFLDFTPKVYQETICTIFQTSDIQPDPPTHNKDCQTTMNIGKSDNHTQTMNKDEQEEKFAEELI